MAEQLSALAAINEVKKMERFLDSLTRLKEVLEVAAGEEKLVVLLKTESEKLKKVVDELAAQVGSLTSRKQDAEYSLKAAEQRFQQRSLEIKEQESRLVSDTQRKLEDMKLQAAVQVESVRMELAKIQPEVKNLLNEKLRLEEDLKNLKNRAESELAGVMSAFKDKFKDNK